jgi:hypothetical protein
MVLQAAEVTNEGQGDELLSTPISRAMTILKDLQEVINAKLIAQGRGSDRVRRTAWLLNKSRIVSLHDNLKETRETLWVAISASLL